MSAVLLSCVPLSRPKAAWFLRSLVLCACIFAFILSAAPLAAADCPLTADTPSCVPCATASSSFIDVSTLPRVDFAGNSVTSNVANLDLVRCGFDNCIVEFPDLDDFTHGRHSSEPFPRYLESLATYSIFGLSLFLCVGAFFVFFFAFRYCCCCVGKGQGPACCGYSSPSPQNRPEYAHTGYTSCCFGCLGYARDGAHPQGFAYPAWQQWCARGLAWVAVALIVSFTIAVAAAGAHKFEPAAQSVAASPQRAASTAFSLNTPTEALLIERANVALTDALQDATRALDTVVPMEEVRSDMARVLEIVPKVVTPTSHADSVPAWDRWTQQAKPATTAFSQAFKTVQDGLGAAYTTLDDFSALFYGDPAPVTSAPPVAPKVTYAALADSATAADAAFAPASARYQALFEAGHRVTDFLTTIEKAGAVGIPAGHVDAVLPELDFFSATEKEMGGLGSMSASAFRIAKETLRTRQQLVARDWATAETAALSTFAAQVDEHLSADDVHGLRALASRLKALASSYPLTPYVDYAAAVTSDKAAGFAAAADTSRTFPSTPEGTNALEAAAARTAEFAEALARFRGTPLVGDDVSSFAGTATESLTLTRRVLSHAKTFNASLIRIDDVLGDAEQNVAALLKAAEDFTTVRQALIALQDAVTGVDTKADSLKLTALVREYAAAEPLTPAARAALTDAATALADPAIAAAVDSASAEALITTVTALEKKFSGLLTTFTGVAPTWRAVGRLFAGVGSTVRRMRQAIRDLDNAQAVCSDDQATPCESSEDCTPGSGAVCSMYTHCMLAAAESPATPLPLQRCATTADCGSVPGSVCGYFGIHARAPVTPKAGETDWEAFVLLVKESWVRHDSNFRDVRASLAAPEFAQADASAIVAKIGDDLTAIVAGTDGLRTAVAAPAAVIAAAAAPLDRCHLAPWQANAGALQVAFSAFPAPNDIISAVNKVVDSFHEFVRIAVPVLSDFYALVGPVITDCLWPLYDAISPATLAPVARERGIGAAARELLTAADEWAGCTNARQKLVKVNPKLVRRSKVGLAVLDRLASTTALEHGPASYLFNLFEAEQLDPSDPSQHRLLWQADGDAYPGGRVCVTHECLSNEAAVWSGGDIGTIIHDVARLVDGRFTADARYSRQYDITLPTIAKVSLIFPALLATVLLAASLLGWFRKTTGFGAASTHLANASLLLSFLVAVGGCVVVAAALWPALIATGDTCQSVNTLASYVVRSVDFCDRFNGSGTNEACTFAADRLNITVDFPAVFDSLATGDCSADSGLGRLWRRAADELASVPNVYIASRLDDPSDPVLSRLGPLMRQPLETFSARSSDIFTAFAAEAQAVAGCEELSRSYRTVLDSACCEGFSALYWTIAGWYLILWCTLICAVPAGVLGRKRFTHFLWGPIFEAHRAKTGALLPAASINAGSSDTADGRAEGLHSGYIDRDIGGEPFSSAVIGGETSERHPYSSL